MQGLKYVNEPSYTVIYNLGESSCERVKNCSSHFGERTA